MDREGSHVLAGLVLQRLGAGDGGSVWFERDAMGQVALWRERPCARGHGGGPASRAGGAVGGGGARLTPQPLPWLSSPAPLTGLRSLPGPFAWGGSGPSPLAGRGWRGAEGSRWEKQPMARSSWDGGGGGGGSRAEVGRGGRAPTLCCPSWGSTGRCMGGVCEDEARDPGSAQGWAEESCPVPPSLALAASEGEFSLLTQLRSSTCGRQ